MKPKYKWHLFVSYLVLGINTLNIFAQEVKTSEILLAEAMQFIYSNPKKSIEIGERLLNNSDGLPTSDFRYLMLLAQAHVMITDYEKSLEYANRALKVSEDNQLVPNQINANTFLGNHYLRLKLNEKAWVKLEGSEKIIKNHPLPDSLNYIQGNVSLLRGYLYETDYNFTKAIKSFDKAATIFRNTENQELGSINLGVALTHKGRALLEVNDLKAAIATFEEVIQISSKINENGVDAFAYLSLAEVYSKQEKYERSNHILFQALDIAEKSSQLELVKEVYNLLSNNYFKMDDLDNFTKYNARYNEATNHFDISETNSVENVAKAVQTEENQVEGWTIRILVLCGILITLISLLFLRSKQMKKRMNQ